MNTLARAIPTFLLVSSATLPLAARADIRSTVTLDLSRISLLQADGTPFAPTDFSHMTVQHRGMLNFQNTFTSTHVGGIFSTDPVDLPATCIGAACPVTSENDFSRSTALPSGVYTSADQRNSGGLLSGDLRLQVRSDIGMQSFGSGNWGADSEATIMVQFRLAQPGTITIEFDATPFVSLSRPQAISEPGERGFAGVQMSFSMHNLTQDRRVFWEFPDPLNHPSRLFIDTDYTLANLVYNPGTMTISYTTPMLNSDDTYEMWIAGETNSHMSPAPEPSSLAMFGAGLASLLALGRRRNPTGQREH